MIISTMVNTLSQHVSQRFYIWYIFKMRPGNYYKDGETESNMIIYNILNTNKQDSDICIVCSWEISIAMLYTPKGARICTKEDLCQSKIFLLLAFTSWNFYIHPCSCWSTKYKAKKVFVCENLGEPGETLSGESDEFCKKWRKFRPTNSFARRKVSPDEKFRTSGFLHKN